MRAGVRPIEWDFTDLSCPQTDDIFTFEPFSDLMPASIIKFYWEYETDTGTRLVESCHNVEQFNAFVANRRAQFPRNVILDPHVQRELTEAQLSEAVARQVFLETSVIAVFLAYLVKKNVLPQSVTKLLGSTAAMTEALVAFNDIPANREYNRIRYMYDTGTGLQALRRAETRVEQAAVVGISGVLVHMVYTGIISALTDKSSIVLALFNMPAKSILALAGIIVVLSTFLGVRDIADKILIDLSYRTGINLPSAAVLAASSYVLFRNLLDEEL